MSTLLDLYAFPLDMPGFPALLPQGTAAKAEAIEAAFANAIQDRRFIPNVVAHEFEGLLFTSPKDIAAVVSTTDEEEQEMGAALAEIAAGFETPEDIDDRPEAAPAVRMLGVCPGYAKTRHGPLIAERIGLAGLRAKCPHFAAWVDKLEALAR